LELGRNRGPAKLGFVKARIARISLAVSATLFFMGFFVLGYCPEWYALAAGFAGLAAWKSAGRTRAWAMIWLIAS
jgi:hypothetical protein